MNADPSAMRIALPGIELHVEIRGDGPPLLLLHGTTGCGGDFRHLFDLDELAREHRLIIPDLRGHGRSPNPLPIVTHRQCAADITALLDALALPPVRAVGVSLGGNVLLQIASARPDRVEAMVLAGVTSHFGPEARAFMAAVTDETRSDDEWRRMRAVHPGGDDQIRAIWRSVRAFAESEDDLALAPRDLAAITARTLLVEGDRDPLYPVEIFVDLYRAIPRAALWIVPNAGHAPIFGDARAEFARLARAFLRG